MNVVQAPSPSFCRWEAPWERNDMLRLAQQVTGKAKTCSTLFLEMCRAGQCNTPQVIKTHSFKQHLLCIFSFVLQTSQLLLSPFHLHSKAMEETVSDSAKLTKIEPPKRQDFCLFSSLLNRQCLKQILTYYQALMFVELMSFLGLVDGCYFN